MSKKNVATKPLSPPHADTILGEATYRGRRIVCTNDPNYCSTNKDGWGFVPPCVYTVLDEFDDVVFPIGMHVFWTPDDAANAIEMLDTIFPRITRDQPNTTLMYEYGRMRQYRRAFFVTYDAVQAMRQAVDDARALDDNPCEDIHEMLHGLHQSVMQWRGME